MPPDRDSSTQPMVVSILMSIGYTIYMVLRVINCLKADWLVERVVVPILLEATFITVEMFYTQNLNVFELLCVS